ncbi:MAG: COX15/CtaA family protein [Pseudomonadota bacterium]
MSNANSVSTAAYGGAVDATAARQIALWLFAMCALIALMLVVGGATRLTDSGLSITEWKPVTGAIPPLSEAVWLAEFEKYKTIPEYQLINFGMSLEEFKVIYWWEWAHRFLGRLIGLAFFVPMAVFILMKKTTASLSWKLFGVFLLGGLQGVMGWYMVQSGLSERVDVSQYRLAAHLSLAVILFACVFWLALNMTQGERRLAPRGAYFLSLGFAAAVFVQMGLGALVAGLRAGKTFNTWPLMDGRFFPKGYFTNAPGFSDLFETIAAVQFNHRMGAYILTALAIWLWFSLRRTAFAPRAKMVLAAVFAQAALGVWTVVAATPLSLGLLHQLGALIVFGAALYLLHGMRPQPALRKALSPAQ